MKKLMLLSIFAFILLIGIVSASEVYQENSDSHSCDWFDWQEGISYPNCTAMYDNLWDFTHDGSDSGWMAWTYENLTYNKPENATNATWQVGYNINSPTIENVSIPVECWDVSYERIELRIGSYHNGMMGYGITFDCWNGTDYIALTGIMGSQFDNGIDRVVEEGMYWDVLSEETLPEEQPAEQVQGVIYQSLAESGAGLGLLMQYLSRSLPLLLIMLAMVVIIGAIGFGIAHAIKNYLR